MLKFIVTFAAVCLLSVSTITTDSCPDGDTNCRTACTSHCAALPGSWTYSSHTFTPPKACSCTCKGAIRTTRTRTSVLQSND